MCQILCLTAHDPARLHEIIQLVWSKMAFTQKDGYGAAWFGADGQIGYLKRRFAKISTEGPLPFVKVVNSTKPTDPFAESNDIPSDGGFLIIHGRMATNEINVANTHPFLDELEDGRRVAMIHNGVVRSTRYANRLDGCTCDSELLLRAYTDGGIEQVERHIDGKYAFMYLEYVPPTEEEVASGAEKGAPVVGRKTLHVAKDSAAFLYCGAMPDKSFVFATNELLIKDVGGDPEGELKNNVLLVYDGPTDPEYTEYKALTWAEKRIAGWFEWENGKPKPPTPPTHSTYPAQHQERQAALPAPRINQLTKLDNDISDEEQAEIEALEREAIDILS